MPTSLSVLWIAPEVPGLPPLRVMRELGQIARIPGVDVAPVTGRVTKDEIAAALAHRCDLVIWSGHGAAGELYIADPDNPAGRCPVRPKWLAMQAHVCLPRLFVLASCSSQLRDEHLRSMADEIARAGVNCIGFPAAADDLAAVQFSTELVRALTQGARLGDAFDVALEEIQTSPTARGVFLLAGLTNGYREVADRLDRMQADIQEIKAALKTRTRKATA